MEQVRVLAVDVTKYFDRCLELNELSFILEALLDLLDQKLDHLNWQVHKRHTLWILSLVCDDVKVEVVDDGVHNKHGLFEHVLLRNVGYRVFELLAPFLLNVESFGFILLRFKILVEQSL